MYFQWANNRKTNQNSMKTQLKFIFKSNACSSITCVHMLTNHFLTGYLLPLILTFSIISDIIGNLHIWSLATKRVVKSAEAHSSQIISIASFYSKVSETWTLVSQGCLLSQDII